jgi:hypothetical protein
MADASTALGAPEVAGVWVNRRGMAKRGMGAVAGAQIGGAVGAAVGSGLSKGSPQPTPETPNFGGFGYLGVSATELVLVKGKRGLVGLKMTDDVVAKVPRSDVVSVDFGEGKLASPLTITFGNGSQWELEVARASRGAGQRVVAELAG